MIDTRSVQVRFLRPTVRLDACQLKFASCDRTGKPVTGIATIMCHPKSVSTRPSKRPTAERPRLLVYQAAIDSLTPLAIRPTHCGAAISSNCRSCALRCVKVGQC